MITLTNTEASRVLAGRQTMVVVPGKSRWRLGGKPHPIQRGAFGSVVGHVRLVAVARIRLASLTEEDAKLCGYASLNSFKVAWRRRYDSWEDGLEVHAIRFVLHDRPERQAQTFLFGEDGSA